MKLTRTLSLLICLAFLCSLIPLTALAAAAPDAPSLSVTQLAGRFRLTWSEPYNGGSAITGYEYSYYPSTEEGSEHPWLKLEAEQNEVTTPNLDLYGQEYTFRIRALNTNGAGAEAVAHKDLYHQNHIEVYRVRDRVEQTSFSASLQEATNEAALKAYLEEQIKEIHSTVKATVVITSFEPAQLTNQGSFQFTVALSLGKAGEPTFASTITEEPIRGIISSAGKLATPKITIATSDEGGLAYQITNTGTAAQAEAIQNYKISVYDSVNDQVVVSDYTVNAAEKNGTVNLSAGLKGETGYRAVVKACSADSLKYLDSDLSEPSAIARAGRIPITVRPNVTEKYYGDTEPIFACEIVKGPDPLPTGVDLKLTFTRAEGTDVGTYSFSFQQTDTNYLVTLEEAVFEILPRPITIRPANREVEFEEGVTFLLQEAGETKNLVEGDKIESLEFSAADAKGAVGEYEILPQGAVIRSGNKDVTKNYDITFEAGVLTIKGEGFHADTTQESGGFPLYLILILIALFLLIVGGVVLFILLRKKENEPTDEELLAADVAGGVVLEDGDDSPSETAGSDSYEEYLEIIDMEEVENAAENEPLDPEVTDDTLPEQESFFPPETDSATQATIEEIESAQAKAESEAE